MSTPTGHTVRVNKLPQCDFCDRLAAVDGLMKRGQWAYMCEDHYSIHGVGLGTGKGQLLIIG